MAESPLDRPIFIGGTGSDGAAALAALLGVHPDLAATEPVRFGVISEPNGLVDAWRLGQSMRKNARTPWWDRVFTEKNPAFIPEPMIGEDRTPPEELVELIHRQFLPDPLLKPLGHRADALTASEIEAASERYLADFWDRPKEASVRLVHDLLQPTHGDPPTRWIDASRLGAVRAPHLIELFPEAHFIHVIRDGRSVALRFVELSTGSSFPGAPVASVPIDPDKEWNQAAFDRALSLWERRLISAASGLQGIPAQRGQTVRLADLQGPQGADTLAAILRRVEATANDDVLAALPEFVSVDALAESRIDEIIPAAERAAVDQAYAEALARLADLGVPTP